MLTSIIEEKEYLVHAKTFDIAQFMSSTPQVTAEDVERELHTLKYKLISRLADDPHFVSGVLDRLKLQSLNMLSPQKRTKANIVDEADYKKHKGTDIVIVREFEVGQCSTCESLGAAGHCCEACGGDILSHLAEGTIPKHLVRLHSKYFSTEPNKGQQSVQPPPKKRKSRPPKTLKEYVSCMMRVFGTDWASNQEDYPQSLLDMFEEEIGEIDSKIRADMLQWAEQSHNDLFGDLRNMIIEDIQFEQDDTTDFVKDLPKLIKQYKRHKKKRKASPKTNRKRKSSGR